MAQNSASPAKGARFEKIVQRLLAERGLDLTLGYQAHIGAGREQRPHRFDLGSEDPPILIECKAHTWTQGGHAPSAKFAVWNEAMHYFSCAPSKYRKILVVLRDEHDGTTLGKHYLARFGHLVPMGAEIWECGRNGGSLRILLDRAGHEENPG